MSPLLAIEDLHIHFTTYDGVLQVLNGVNLYVRRGERVALVGESGCGKSITLRAILGILPIPPAQIVSGRILFNGTNLLQLDEPALRDIRGHDIAFIPQEPGISLNPVFTVGEQFVDLLLWHAQRFRWRTYLQRRMNRHGRQQAFDRVLELLEQVQIPDPKRVMRSYPVELSGGMKQRVLIAMALASNPSLLLADEPTTALDVTTQDEIIGLLKELAGHDGLSMLYVTHNLGVARQIAERTYVMYAGDVAESAPTELLLRNPLHPYTQGLLASIPRLTGRQAAGIGGLVPDYLAPPSGCRFHPRCPYAMSVCVQKTPALSEEEPQHYVACHLYS